MDEHAKAIKVLRESRSFGALDEVVLNDLASALEFSHVRGGSVVYREGQVSDSMLFVISGGLRVSRLDRSGELNLYNEVRPGQSVGEVGLILQQCRTSDVTAVRDSSLAMLSRAAYEALLTRHPLALNRIFVQTVYEFMRHSGHGAERRYAHTYVVVPLDAAADAHEVASSLTLAFAAMGRVQHLRPPVNPNEQTQDTSVHADRALHDSLENDFDYLVYQADASPSSWTRRAFRQADQVIFVASVGATRTMSEIEQRLTNEPGFSMKRKHLVVLHPASAERPSDVALWRAAREFERIYPLRCQHRGDFARLARFLTGSAVGVVLGGGGARGFAHLGVLRALEERGIPIDLVGGNSMGALIGAQYACDVSLDEIRQRTQAFAAGGERPTLPVISLVSGRRVERDLRRMFGERLIEELWRPYFAAACNLSTGTTTVQDRGLLWRAVLASNSPAGLFPPVLVNGDLLVDGAILENVPVGAMRVRLGTPLEKRRGNGTIIAIDVDVRDGLGADPSLARLSVWRTLKAYFAPADHPSPGIGAILYTAGHIGGANQRGRTIAQADHYLEPPVAEFSLMGYKLSEEIAQVGYRYAMEKIEKWTQPISTLPNPKP